LFPIDTGGIIKLVHRKLKTLLGLHFKSLSLFLCFIESLRESSVHVQLRRTWQDTHLDFTREKLSHAPLSRVEIIKKPHPCGFSFG